MDSLADAHLNIGACRGDVSSAEVFGRWLRGVARNKYRNWARTCARSRKFSTTSDPKALEQVVAPTNAVDERLVQLREEIERLPSRQKEVVMMHYLDGNSVADVAALLSISVKSVEGRLYQARKRLRQRLNDTGSWAKVAKAVLL